MELHTPEMKDVESMLKQKSMQLAGRTTADELNDILALTGTDCVTKFVKHTRKIQV